MPSRLRIALGCLLSFTMMISAGCSESVDSQIAAARTHTNILLVVADDLGMFDIGAYGGEIRTPNIDRLASTGIKFSNFYTSATCSPSRAMLLSGVDSHAAGLGNMVEHMAPNQRGREGYEGYLSQRVVSVATLLQDAGYRTYMAGKWHLGKKDHLLPYRRGFDESFVLLQGGASYFSNMRGLKEKLPDAHYRRNSETVKELPEDFYATEYYADFIIDQIAADRDENQPFFAYLAFTAPHWPLQVRDEHRDLYAGRYDEGYEVLHEKRVAAGKDLGVLRGDMISAPLPDHILPWAALNDGQRKVAARTMEIYAAVVERMDYHLGRVLAYLEEINELENTLIIFLSDNGADGLDHSKLPGNEQWLQVAWDLSYENMGRPDSYVYQGAAWARTSVGPFRMYKQYLTEGGIRSPAIISHSSVVNRGPQSGVFATVKDITPTILAYAGVDHPGEVFRGREIVPPSGISLKPFLVGDKERPHSANGYIAWELFGQKAVRKGDWKLVWLSSKPKWLYALDQADQWGLYNLALDPAEMENLAEQEPEKLKELQLLWQQYVEEQGVILPNWN